MGRKGRKCVTRRAEGKRRGNGTTGKDDLLKELGRIVSLIDLDRREQNSTLISLSSKDAVPPTGGYWPQLHPQYMPPQRASTGNYSRSQHA